METNYINIEYNGQPVDVLHYLSESANNFDKKLEFIKKLEKKNIAWKEANKLSKIWYNIKFKGCKYSPDIYHKIVSLDK